MKRIVVGVFIIIALLVLAVFLNNGGRFSATSKPVEREFLSTSNYANFRIIETGTPQGGGKYFILVDDTTGVLYFRHEEAYSAVMSPLLNNDGTPKLLSDFESDATG